ncbi:MAG: DUF2490 domain-containing protein [Planctomycetes bacterium]|nr:DUF2490 domain-containing protein [Planctomycetota bacterium]
MSKFFKSTLFILSSMFVLVTIAGGNCFGSTDGNAEYWQEVGFDFNIYKNWKVTVREELRFGKSGDDPYLHNTNVGLVYKGFGDWIDVSLDFKKEFERDSTGKFRRENRPHLNLNFKGEMYGLKLGNRVRFEFREKETDDHWRFRNKLTLNLPFKLTKFNLQPYFSDEIFINMGESIVKQNRFVAGLSFKLSKNVKTKLYYMYKSNMTSSSGWVDTNVIGTGVVFTF